MLLGRIVFLQQLKEELIEKLKNPATTYSSMTDIHKQLRQINREIQSIRQLENTKEANLSGGKKVVQHANAPYENFN